MENKPYIFIFGFISSIFLCSFFNIGITFSLFLVFIAFVLYLFNKLHVLDFESGQKIFLLIIFIISFALGVFRYEIKDSILPDKNLEENIDDKVTLVGVISDEPKRKDQQDVLIIDFENILISGSNTAVFGRGIVSTDLYPEFKYGDRVKVYGKLQKPENFSDSNSFDYVSYLAKDDIFYKIDFAKIEYLSSGNGNIIKSFLFSIKNKFIGNINRTIKSPESDLLSGILLGAKDSIDQKTQEDFRKSGLSHVVALSGYNITIVSDAIMKTLYFLPRNLGFLGGILGIILFVIMSGGTSTAVRAAVMALIVILAQVTHRNYQAGRALVFAGLLMVMVNPKILVFDISFQLSFLATIAIIYLAPILNTKFTFITEKFKLREVIASTIAAQILVLPLILYKMGLLSLVALPANILALVFMPETMFFGFIVGFLGFLWLPLSIPFAWVSYILLAYMITIAKFFANLPLSTINISWFSSGIMVLSYIFIFLWIFIENKRLDVKN